MIEKRYALDAICYFREAMNEIIDAESYDLNIKKMDEFQRYMLALEAVKHESKMRSAEMISKAIDDQHIVGKLDVSMSGDLSNYVEGDFTSEASTEIKLDESMFGKKVGTVESFVDKEGNHQVIRIEWILVGLQGENAILREVGESNVSYRPFANLFFSEDAQSECDANVSTS